MAYTTINDESDHYFIDTRLRENLSNTPFVLFRNKNNY